MADDDFDIDIYGDADEEDQKMAQAQPAQVDHESKHEEPETTNGHSYDSENNGYKPEDGDYVDIKVDIKDDIKGPQKIKSTDESSHAVVKIPKQAPQQQGVKRKEGSDERPIESGATSAILISDLHWWNTDDDIRGWVNQAQCEDELIDITFSEHKVNGKSKGQAYVEFSSQQAATAAKQKIDAFGNGQQYVKKHVVNYSNPNINPFKSLPKDAPVRVSKDGPGNRAVSGNYESSRGNFGNNNFRGRGGYGNRGAMNNMGGGFRGNFTAGMNNRGSFQGQNGGFQGNNMGGGFGNFNNGMMNVMRGGAGGFRGGRGGMSTGMGNGMMGIPMGGVPMGGVPMPMGSMGGMGGMGGPMGMNNMGGGMPGAGFQGMQQQFNPTFFQQQSPANDWQNPHGAKRQRPE